MTEKSVNAEGKKTYSIKYRCNNCDYSAKVEVECGTFAEALITSMRCPNCMCPGRIIRAW